MNTNTTAPFAAGDRVTRNFDGAAGTVETVTPWDSDTGSWAIAVRLDKDGDVWSGTEVAWAPATTPTRRPATVREADRRHDFETEGRQDERAVTPCAVCGLARTAPIHA